MYKVYHDPEGKSVMASQQNMTSTYTFQCSEETYKEQIEKLRKENAYLKNKVSAWLAKYNSQFTKNISLYDLLESLKIRTSCRNL